MCARERKRDILANFLFQVEAPVKKAVATVCGGGGGDEKGGRRRSVVLLAGKQADKTETSK